MKDQARIREIFSSIQGEGPYIGYKQLFIRFCGCNLSCNFCDTSELPNEEYLEFSPSELREYLNEFDIHSIHSVSLTGGEPLIWVDFLLEFLPMLDSKIYLETNSTLNTNLERIINLVDVISADIKLPSASGIENSFAIHDEFFKVAKKYNKEIFAKVVFDENILDDEIAHCIKLAEKYTLPLILQPKTIDDKVSVNKDKITEIHNKFLKSHANTRVIPQVHVFLGVQ
jgi:organic radical activating enzyme